jgi:hypothetical protein
MTSSETAAATDHDAPPVETHTHHQRGGHSPSHSHYEIPDFDEDRKIVARYEKTLDRKIKQHGSDQKTDIERAFAIKRDTLNAELNAAQIIIDDRTTAAQKAVSAYKARYPKRVPKNKPMPPPFFESLLSFGAAGKLYRTAVEATRAASEARSTKRKLEHRAETLDSDLAKEIARAEAAAKETIGSPEWLAAIHKDPELATLKKRVDEIAAESEHYANRLKTATVSAMEQRDRSFAEAGVQPIELPLSGIMFYRVATFRELSYFILRDLTKRLYALPYDPRLEHIVDGVFDIYRVGATFEVKLRVREDTRLPFTIYDHFLACAEKDEIMAKDAFRRQRTWMREPRAGLQTTDANPLEAQTRDLLAAFAATLAVSPRAPQIA